MKILLSPAKSLDEKSDYPNLKFTNPLFLKQTNQLVEYLKTWEIDDFTKNMHLSENLAILNYERYQNWISPDKLSDKRRPAIFSFDGEAYKGFNIHSLSQEHYETLNNSLCLLSGLYGILRPFDYIFPYRLEMGTKAKFGTYKNLYDYWDNTLIDYLNKHEKEIIFNLASSEYFKAAKLAQAKAEVITPVFKDLKNGELKTIMMYAKHQRGKFARFLIENPTLTINEYKLYQEDGYHYQEELSSKNEWVFVKGIHK
jgi:hypothetical protein